MERLRGIVVFRTIIRLYWSRTGQNEMNVRVLLGTIAELQQ